MENNSYKDLYNASLLAEYGIKDVNIITKAWQETHRFYHTEKHLSDLLLSINALSIDDIVPQKDRDILQIVAYFHDIVYDQKTMIMKRNQPLFLENMRTITQIQNLLRK